MTELRPYQAKAVDDLRASLRIGHKAPLLVMPTGSGKTHVAKTIIEAAVAKGSGVLFLAPRRELIFQTAEKLDAAGIEHGIIMAGESQQMFAPVQVACIPTLYRRLEHAYPPPADLIVIDEAHLSISRMAQAVLAAYPGAVRIGLTATPARADGQGLGELYDDLVMGPSVRELTDAGFLVEAEYFAPSAPDLQGVRLQAGDYNTKQLGERMQPLIGDVVTNWLRIASDRQTVVFAVNVAHSRHLCERFMEAGVAAEHLDARTPNDERRAILRRVQRGDTQVICNCDVLSYGWDAPPISCAVLARPTKSVARYLQAAGRVLRPYPGKDSTIIIDHAGIVDTLGFVDDEFPWTLDGKSRIQDRKDQTLSQPKPLTCPECFTVFQKTDTCPACGHRMVSQRRQAIAAFEAELAKVDRATGSATKSDWTLAQKQIFFSELLHVAKARGYKEGWASMKYRERLGVWPTHGIRKIPAEPRPETLSWIRSRQIAWAKMKEKREARHAA